MIAEPILNALLHLFAMLASRLDGEEREAAHRKVLSYLNNHVGLADAGTYVGLYKDLIEVHEGEADAAMLESAGQVAARLKSLLHGSEKHAAVIRFLELAALAPHREWPRRMARLLSGELGIHAGAAETILLFIADPEAALAAGGACRALGGGEGGFQGRLAALRLPDEHLYLVSPVGGEPVWLEGQLLEKGACRSLLPGCVLRDRWGRELYFAHVAAAFEDAPRGASRIDFRAAHLDYRFPGSDNGLRDFSFAERGGRLVGIMGGSGAGKSTLLGVLNGTLRPDSGQLLLNGSDAHAEPEACEGVIGFVPQDDLLFEDLTVYENLYYAARLCMADLSEEELARRVRKLLDELGQSEAAGLKVGSPLQKTISGGQRKRLNIALELIREPNVLFVDEPTSGLSSADSEMVMSLLKEQAARDKLVFVVIHQPSSKIYRMFDALWILDQGGWPVFNGAPIEAIAYFRSRGGLPGEGEAICANCGGVHPEQIFEILESKTLDNNGRFTRERRVPPEKWSELYRAYDAGREKSRPAEAAASPPPPLEKSLRRPGLFGQLKVFFARDVRARLSNRSYALITLLEPPLLGLLIGLVSRGAFGGEYSFHDNNNLHVFFFMSVMVALFLGLSVSAEEICRDGKILRRERFLHLSWWSYINSKTLYLAGAAALQMLLYTAVANGLVQAPGLFLKSWALLFLCAFCSSLLGLNLSASFRSAVTIYILIPLVLIPQMLLCGVVIKYDDLIAPNSLRRDVPRYANLLPPRWGYEALVVEQYAHNAYTRNVVEADAVLRQAEHDLDYYLPELASRVQSIPLLRERPGADGELAAQLLILKNEFARLEKRAGLPSGLQPADFEPGAFKDAAARQAGAYLAECRRFFFERRRAASEEKRRIEAALEQAHGREGVEALKKRHTNLSIERQALNLHDLEPVGAAREGLFQRTLPIYQTPESPWGEAPFLARQKRLGGFLVPTYAFNMLALLGLSLLLYLALCGRLLPRLLGFHRRGGG